MTRTPAPKSALPDFGLDDAVRLLAGHGDVPAGAVGRVLGKFARPNNPTYVVCFVDKKVSALELRPNEIALLDASHADN